MTASGICKGEEMGVLIREVRPEDVETAAAIAVAAWEPIYAHYRSVMGEEMFRALYPDWRGRKAGQVRRACEPASGVRVRVAELDGRVVGFVTFHADAASDVGEIDNNAVDPSAQGKGVAQKMYARVFDEMRALGVKVVKVTTGGDPAHAPARRAYERAGFDVQLPSVTCYRRL
jgi:GNAT superfamily N-acetyltransferase